VSKRTPKEKLLIALEADEKQANAEVKRWDTTVNRYDADMIFNQEHDLPSLPTIKASRDLAKQEAAEARELRRLYGVAIDAVRGA
jgi:hypothetical protein